MPDYAVVVRVVSEMEIVLCESNLEDAIAEAKERVADKIPSDLKRVGQPEVRSAKVVSEFYGDSDAAK